MKNKKLSLGMLVMVLAFGMSVVGCDLDAQSHSVSISGAAIVGESITATSSGNFTGSFQWQFSQVGVQSGWQSYWVDGSGGTHGQWNQIQAVRVGRYIRAFRLTYQGRDRIYSNILGPIRE